MWFYSIYSIGLLHQLLSWFLDILFGATVFNRAVLQFSISSSFLFEYRNATRFCILFVFCYFLLLVCCFLIIDPVVNSVLFVFKGLSPTLFLSLIFYISFWNFMNTCIVPQHIFYLEVYSIDSRACECIWWFENEESIHPIFPNSSLRTLWIFCLANLSHIEMGH